MKNVRERPRRRRPMSDAQIDITSIIEAPLRLRQDGKTRNVAPFEAIFRQHVRKAVVGRAIASMRFVIKQAEKYKLLKPPPPPRRRGGLLIVPKNLPEAIEREIFDYHPVEGQEPDSAGRVARVLLRFYYGQKR